MRCPDCNKFVGYEEQDPEVESLEISDGHVDAVVRIVNVCQDCSTELKEAQLDMSEDVSADLQNHREECKHKDQMTGEDESDFNVDGTHEERDQKVEGKGRGAKTFYGARVGFKINCSHCSEGVGEGELEEFVQASSMDECV